MAKKNKKTFAQRAKDIEKKYPKAGWDPIEKRDMEEELSSLMEEQESIRQTMGMTDQSQMAGGGRMKYQHGSLIPSEFATRSAVELAQQYNPIPSEFATRSAVQLGPALRGQNLAMPLADLSGIEPGVTDVTVTAPNLRRQRMLENKYTQPAPPPGITNSLGFQSPQLDTLSKAGMTYPAYNPPATRAGYTPNTPVQTKNPPKTKTQTSVTAVDTREPVTPEPTQIERDPMLTDTTKMGMRIGDRVYTRPGEDMGVRVGGAFASGVASLSAQDLGIMPNQSGTASGTSDNVFIRKPDNNQGEEQSFWDKNKQYLPYAISGASNIIGNLLLANMAKKNQPRVSPALASAERINLEPQAEALRKRAGVTKNVALRNARNLGVNAGQALANMGAIGAQVDRGLGENLTSLYMQQEGANVGAQNRVNLANQAAQNRANMMNTQLQQQGLQDRLGFMSGALGTIPGVMKDIRMDKADQEMRNIMDRYYQSIGGKNYATVGSIWKDPESGFRFRVKADKTLERIRN